MPPSQWNKRRPKIDISYCAVSFHFNHIILAKLRVLIDDAQLMCEIQQGIERDRDNGRVRQRNWSDLNSANKTNRRNKTESDKWKRASTAAPKQSRFQLRRTKRRNRNSKFGAWKRCRINFVVVAFDRYTIGCAVTIFFACADLKCVNSAGET